MAEPSGADPGGLSGKSGGRMADIRTQFKVDAKGMEKVVDGFKSIRKDVEWLSQNIKSVIDDVSNLATALGQAGEAASGLGRGSGKTTTTTAQSINSLNTTKTKEVQDAAIKEPAVAGAGGGKTAAFANFMGGRGQAIGSAVTGVMQIGSGVISAIDKRIDSAYGEMLANDRLAVLYQQTMGITQQQYINQYRKPLVGQRLGEGGMNTLLALQSQTGLMAGTQASSVAALRAATGYAYSTQDLAQAMTALASPTVNNRLTMTLGTGMYGFGGQQRPMLKVFQDIVQGAGLTNENVLKGAMQVGSVTRARLAAYGLPEDMQNMLLNYAQSNLQYQKKGGRGMYDPSREADRRMMGIEDNFATQFEETQRTSQERNERFYSRQADNFAKLEEQTQRLIKAFAAVEDKLSGLIGARLNQRNNPWWNIGKKVLGGAMMIGGIAMQALPVAGQLAGAGLIAGGATMAFGPGGDPPIGRFKVGDPPASRGAITNRLNTSATGKTGKPSQSPAANTYDPNVPVAFSLSKTYPLSQLNKWSSFGSMDPTMQTRVARLLKDALASGLNVGIGTGYRTNTKEEFLSRYQVAKPGEDADWTFEGKPYKLKPGSVPYAPPGFSMHEAGFAVDIFGDTAKLAEMIDKNPQYGLRHFRDVNGEDWHLQPAELPDGFPSLGIFGQVEGYSKTGMEAYESYKQANPASRDYQSPFVQEAFAAGGVSPHGTNITGSGGTSSGGSAGVPRVTTSGSSYMQGGQSVYQGQTPSMQLRRVPIYSQMSYSDQLKMMNFGDSTMGTFQVPYPSVATPNGRGGDINITVSPTFHISSSGNPATDGKRAAQEMVKVIEREMKIAMMRTT